MAKLKKYSSVISLTSMSETLSKGIAKRIFRDIEGYCNNKANPIYGKRRDNIKEAFDFMVAALYLEHQKRNTVYNLIKLAFEQVFFPYEKCISVGHNHEIIHGMHFFNDKIYVVGLELNKKKPHRSRFLDYSKIGFTRHAVERLIYRLKPRDIGGCLVLIAPILWLSANKLSGIHGAGDGVWIYLKGIGGFFLNVDLGDSRSLALVTFVDCDKFSETQHVLCDQILIRITGSEDKEIVRYFSFLHACLLEQKSQSVMQIATGHSLNFG